MRAAPISKSPAPMIGTFFGAEPPAAGPASAAHVRPNSRSDPMASRASCRNSRRGRAIVVVFSVRAGKSTPTARFLPRLTKGLPLQYEYAVGRSFKAAIRRPSGGLKKMKVEHTFLSRRQAIQGLAAAAAVPLTLAGCSQKKANSLIVGGLPVTCNLTLPVACVGQD